MKALRFSFLLILAAALVGCQAPKPIVMGGPEDYGAYPDDYEQLVKTWIAAGFRDLDSVKQLDIKQPKKAVYQFPGSPHRIYGYEVIVWLNAKNAYGGYTGLQNYSVIIRNGTVLHSRNLSRLEF